LYKIFGPPESAVRPPGSECQTLVRRCFLARGHAFDLSRLEGVRGPRVGRCRKPEADMKLKLVALIAALALPAIAWAGSQAGSYCPIPCQDCPFAKR
jgi:hypothetical protein